MKKIPVLLMTALLIACGGEKKEGDTSSLTSEEKSAVDEKYPEPIGDCPTESVIDQFTTSFGPYEFMNKWDFSGAKNSGALLQGGDMVKIAITNNKELKPGEMIPDITNVPLNNTDDFIFSMSLCTTEDGTKILPGEYSVQNDYGKKSANIEMAYKAKHDGKGHNAILVFDSGKVVILSITKDKICGTFDLKGEKTNAKGSFNAKLVRN